MTGYHIIHYIDPRCHQLSICNCLTHERKNVNEFVYVLSYFGLLIYIPLLHLTKVEQLVLIFVLVSSYGV